ncbi:MAG: hypothetical protein AB7E45_02120 [Candidatus Caldatribacteriota bacterium]
MGQGIVVVTQSFKVLGTVGKTSFVDIINTGVTGAVAGVNKLGQVVVTIGNFFKALGLAGRTSLNIIATGVAGVIRSFITWNNVIQLVKTGLASLAATLGRFLLWFAVFEVAMITYEKISKFFAARREEAALIRRNEQVWEDLIQSQKISRADITNMVAEYHAALQEMNYISLDKAKGELEKIEQTILELQERISTARSEADIPILRGELERAERTRQVLETIINFEDQIRTSGLKTYNIRSMLRTRGEEATIEYVLRHLEEQFGKIPDTLAAQLEKYGYIVGISEEQLRSLERQINNTISAVNRELSAHQRQLEALKQSYFGLGVSTEYYTSILSSMGAYSDVLIKAQDRLENQLSKTSIMYEKVSSSIVDYERRMAELDPSLVNVAREMYETGKSLDMMKDKLGTGLEIGTGERLKKEGKDITGEFQRINDQYVKAREYQERLRDDYDKILQTLDQTEEQWLKLNQDMFELIMSTDRYAGAWQSIKETVDIVKSTMVELYNLQFRLKAIPGAVRFGEKIFGPAWSGPSWAIQQLTSSMQNLFERYYQLEQARQAYGTNWEKLRDALLEIQPLDVRMAERLKVNVTDPLTNSATQVKQSLDSNRASIDRLNETMDNYFRTSVKGLQQQIDYARSKYGTSVEWPSSLREVTVDVAKRIYGATSAAEVAWKAASRFGVDPRLLFATIDVESSWRSGEVGDKSLGGSYGIGQIFRPLTNFEQFAKAVDFAAQQGYLSLRQVEEAVALAQRGKTVGYEGLTARERELLGQYLKNEAISAAMSAMHLVEDIKKAEKEGSGLVGVRRYYKGDTADLDRWFEALRRYGYSLNLKPLKEYEVTQKELIETQSQFPQKLREMQQAIVEQIHLLPESMKEWEKVIPALREIWPTIDINRVEVVQQALNTIKDAVLTWGISAEAVEEPVKVLLDYLYKISKVDIAESLERELRIRNTIAAFIPSQARKVSEIIEDHIQKLINLLSDLPYQQWGEVLREIMEYNAQLGKAKLREAWEEALNTLQTQVYLRKVAPSFAPNWDQMVNSLVDALLRVREEGLLDEEELEPHFRAIEEFSTALKYDISMQMGELSRAVRDLNNTIGVDYWKGIDTVLERYEALFTISEKIEKLSRIFEVMPFEVPGIYEKLAEQKTLQANRDLNILYEQIRQVTIEFQKATPLSMSYFTLLEDLVNLYERENSLLERRVELTRDLFRATGEGLEEFLEVSAQRDAYALSLLNNLRAQVFNLALDTDTSDQDRYYALLKELVNLERQWRDILQERVNLLSESFKVGAIDLDTYVAKLKELRTVTYDLRTGILDFYTGLGQNVQTGFVRALSATLTGSLTYREDFLSGLKESLADLFSQTFANVLFSSAPVRELLDNITLSITEALYTGNVFNIDPIRQSLQELLNFLTPYLPAYKQALQGIFETLKDQVFNAPSGFKIERYLYEYLKARGPEEIPGLRLPEMPATLPTLPTMPSTGTIPEREVTEVVTSPLQNTLERVFVDLDGFVSALENTSNRFFNWLYQGFDTLFRSLMEKFEIPRRVELPPERLYYDFVREITPQLYENIQGTTYMPARDLARILGTTVDWDNVAKQVIIGGMRFTPLASKLQETNVAWVPIRQVAEALDYTVRWDERTKNVIISKSISIDQELIKQSSILGSQTGLLGSISSGTIQSNQILGVVRDREGEQVVLLSMANGTIAAIPATITTAANSLGQAISRLNLSPTINVSVSGTSVTTRTSGGGGGGWENIPSTPPPPPPGGYGTSVTEAGGWDAWERMIERDLMSQGWRYDSSGVLRPPGSFHRGGIVSDETLAFLRRDEMVLPPHLTREFVRFLDRTFPTEIDGRVVEVNQDFNIQVTIQGNVDKEVDIKRAIKEGIAEALQERDRLNRLGNLRKYGVSYSF